MCLLTITGTSFVLLVQSIITFIAVNCLAMCFIFEDITIIYLTCIQISQEADQVVWYSKKGPKLWFSSSHVWMWESDYKESWVQKNWYFWTVVLEKTPESPLDCKDIQPVHPKGNQSWIFMGRTDAEAETPILWTPNAKNRFIGKDPDAGKDWRQEEKGMTEDEMVGWHHWCDGYEFNYAPGVGDGQGRLVCYSPQGCRVRHDCVAELN